MPLSCDPFNVQQQKCLYTYIQILRAYPAEMLLTLWFTTYRLPVLMGSDHVRLVMSTTGQFAFKYGQCVYTACQELVLGHV